MSRDETQTEEPAPPPYATLERYCYITLLGLMSFEYAVTTFQAP